MKYLLCVFWFFAFIKADFLQAAQDYYQKVNWEIAPLNPIGFKNHKSHFKLQGNVMMYGNKYFDSSGMLLITTDYLVVNYFYDNQGRIIQISNNEKVDYGKNSLVSKLFNKNGIVYKTFNYDASGNLVEEIQNSNISIKYKYDSLNRVVSKTIQSETSNQEWAYSYRVIGDTVEVTTTDAATNKIVIMEVYKNGLCLKTSYDGTTWKTIDNVFDKKNNLLYSGGYSTEKLVIYYSDAPIKVNAIWVDFGFLNNSVYVNGVQSYNYSLNKIGSHYIIYLPQNRAYYILQNKKYTASSGIDNMTLTTATVLVKNETGITLFDEGRLVNSTIKAYDGLGVTHVYYYKMGNEHIHYFTTQSAMNSAGTLGLVPLDKQMDGNYVFYTKFTTGNFDIMDKGKLFDPSKYKIIKNKDGSLMYLPNNKSLPTYFLDNPDKAVVDAIIPASSNEQVNDQAQRLMKSLPEGLDTVAIVNKATNKTASTIQESKGTTYTYYGEMRSATFNGFGCYTWLETQSVTIGFWEKGLREGLHIKRDKTGHILEAGYYVKDKLLSNQKWTSNTESSPGCIGNCVNGFGQFKTPEGNLFIGFFKKAQLEGVAIMRNANGSQYEGSVKNGLRHGYGDWYAANGQVFRGYFENDQINGYGILTEKEGTIKKGIFKDNVLITPM